MNRLGDGNCLILHVGKHIQMFNNFNLEEEVISEDFEIAINDRKFTSTQDSIEALKNHGGNIKKLNLYTNEQIPSSSLFEVLNSLPSLEEIDLHANQGFITDETTTKLDFFHIKSLHVHSESSFDFLSLLIPENNLKELTMNYYSPEPCLDAESFENFIKKQNSIKSFSTDRNMPLDALNFLTLDELNLGYFVKSQEVLKVIKGQPELKKLKNKIREEESETFEEVCKLSKLEVLEIKVRGIKDGQNLENLKNLKELKLIDEWENVRETFFTFKLESLEKLSLIEFETIDKLEILEKIAFNFPNLKALELKTTQELNFIVKIFPNLEELTIDSQSCDFDTEIINENLKKLNFILNDSNICEVGEKVFNFSKIFPNLECLKIKLNNPCDENHAHFSDKSFFAKLNTLEKLKSIELGLLRLKDDKNDLMEIAEEIKKLPKKFEFVKLFFVDFFKEIEEVDDYETLMSHYDSFTNEIESDFKILNKQQTFDCDFGFLVAICHEKYD